MTELRGSYALFLKGQPSDEPMLVGNNPVWLSKAGDAIWGFGNCLVELWQTKLDQEYALRSLQESRTEASP